MAKTSSPMAKIIIILLAAFVVLGALAGVGVYCAHKLVARNCANVAGWGTGPKVATTQGGTTLTGVTAEPSHCFDRLVVNLSAPTVHYNVRYASAVAAQGSGRDITLAGGAKLQIDVDAAAYDADSGATLYPATVDQTLPGLNIADYAAFRDLKWGGSFEGQSTIGVGLRARLPYRVLNLGNQLIVDVAHQ